MDLKKQGVGFYLNIVVAVLSIVALIAYLVNTQTDYFWGQGINIIIVASLVIAIVASAAVVLVPQFVEETVIIRSVLDLLAVAAVAFLVAALLTLAGDRIYYIATIFTYEYSPERMAQLMSALVSLGAILLATIVSFVASFQVVKKA